VNGQALSSARNCGRREYLSKPCEPGARVEFALHIDFGAGKGIRNSSSAHRIRVIVYSCGATSFRAVPG